MSESDIAWWTGFRQRTVRDAVASLPTLTHASIEGLDDSFLIHEADLAAGQASTDMAAKEVSLLPVLDPYLQGYRNRERHVEPRHQPFVVDRGGNATSVILVDGRPAGVWDLITKPSPELRVFFFDSPNRVVRGRAVAVAAELAEFITGESTPVREVDRMTPLTSGKAGSFLSPLKHSR